MNEAEILFQETEQHRDGTARFGAEQSASRRALHQYARQVMEFREKVNLLQ